MLDDVNRAKIAITNYHAGRARRCDERLPGDVISHSESDTLDTRHLAVSRSRPTKERTRMTRYSRRRVLAGALSTAAAATGVRVAGAADEAQEAEQLVEKSRLAFESLMEDTHLAAFKELLKKARGLFLAPSVLRGAFFVGAAGGSGTFLARDEKAGRWNGPAFYTLGELSFGLQAGGDSSEVAIVAMTERGVTAMLGTNIKLGTDASIAAGPFGVGVSEATANTSVDLLSFSRSKGLYGGVSLQGAAVAARGSLNKVFYGREISVTDILVRGEVSNPKAAPLVQAVARAAAR
jgi:lipid-binding SYLF domain-containing protein